MTSRSSFQHRRKELAAALFGLMASRGLSRRDTGLDRVAKSLIERQAGELPHDPELDHPVEWDRPID